MCWTITDLFLSFQELLNELFKNVIQTYPNNNQDLYFFLHVWNGKNLLRVVDTYLK